MWVAGTTLAPVTWFEEKQKPGSKKPSASVHVGPMFGLKHLSRRLSSIGWIKTHRTLAACPWHRRAHSVLTRLCRSHLVRVHQPGVREVERGDEEPDTLALHPVPVKVVGDDPGHKVLARARPAMEGECQWLVGLRVVDETLDGFQNHRLDQVLSVELGLEVPRQTCTCHRREDKDGHSG